MHALTHAYLHFYQKVKSPPAPNCSLLPPPTTSEQHLQSHISLECACSQANDLLQIFSNPPSYCQQDQVHTLSVKDPLCYIFQSRFWPKPKPLDTLCCPHQTNYYLLYFHNIYELPHLQLLPYLTLKSCPIFLPEGNTYIHIYVYINDFKIQIICN